MLEARESGEGAALAMGVYARGNVLWIKFQDATGTWHRASTGYRVGEETRAQITLSDVEAEISLRRPAAIAGKAKALTIADYAEQWLETRETETVNDDRGRIAA